MTTRQFVFLVALVTILAAGLAWALQRIELDRLHGDITKYLANYDAFKEWEAENGS